MTFGTFTFKGHFDALNGAPASGVVHIEGLPNVLVDLAGNKITVGPKAVVLDQLGNFSVSLPVDTTYNGGLRNGFRVTPNLKGLASVGPTEFYAPTPGQTLDYSDVIQQTVVSLTPTGVSQADFDAYVAAHGDGGGGGGASPGVCNVLDYGGIGDGIADDSNAILAAISACPVDGTVLLPGGYRFNTPAGKIVINKRITFAGPGTLAVVSQLDASVTGALTVIGIYIPSGGSGSTIRDLHLENPGDVMPPTTYGNGSNNYGIQIRANEVTVTGCIIESFLMGVAVHQGGEWFRTKIIGNYIKDVLGAGSSTVSDGEDRGDGIVTWGAETVIADNIVTAKDGADCRIGIHYEGLPQSQAVSPQFSSTSTTITGNIVIGGFRRSIAIEDGDHGVITGNTVAGATWWGIVVSGDAFGTVVNGNTVQWTRTAANTAGATWSPTRSGLHILGRLKRCTFSNNVVRVVAGAALDAAISIKSNGTNQYPVDNVITGNIVTVEDTGVVARGIYLTGGNIQGAKITNNSLRGAFTANGIDCAGVSTGDFLVEIDGNTVDGIAATAGVRGIIHSVNGSTGVRTIIRNNSIRNFDKGIERFSGVGTLITGNRIASCNTGIDAGSGTGNQVTGNNLYDSVTTKFTGITHGVNGCVLRNNLGVVHEARGTGVIADVTASIVVTHGLTSTPTTVVVTPRINELLWVSARSSTTFTVTRAGTAGAHTFDWRAEV